MNHYQILEVQTDATSAEIKKAYRKLVKVHHPDAGGNDDTFKQISVAYEILSDDAKRNAYDIKIGLSESAYTSNSWQDFFNRAYNGAGFSGAFDRTYGEAAKGPDVKVRFDLTMEEVYYGTTKYVDVGDGKFNVKIPKGIRNGAKLRIKGRGRSHPYNSSAPKGDIILIMNWLVDSDLIVNGDHIWVDLSLPFYDMLLGAEVEIQTKVNRLKINIPKNAYEGQLITISGGGMPIYNTDKYGNLMVKLIAKPVKLNKTQIELVEKIKEMSNV